jgi:transcriptional regulator GlxA family with amidase domain
MELAKTALSETTGPISQIAFSLGFSDAHNFSNAFHEITGLSPSEYRASYNKHNVFQK